MLDAQIRIQTHGRSNRRIGFDMFILTKLLLTERNRLSTLNIDSIQDNLNVIGHETGHAEFLYICNNFLLGNRGRGNIWNFREARRGCGRRVGWRADWWAGWQWQAFFDGGTGEVPVEYLLFSKEKPVRFRWM